MKGLVMAEEIFLLDIGGTNARVYIFDEKRAGKAEIVAFFQPKSFYELKELLKEKLKDSCKNLSVCACFAGKVLKEEKIVSVTKWDERANIENLFNFLKAKRIVFLNDAEAAVLGLEFIRRTIDAEIIFGNKNKINQKPFSLLYLGTGLGAASFYEKPISSEISSLQMPFRKGEKLNSGKNLLIDDIVSGRGLSEISKALYRKNIEPEMISKKIISGKSKNTGKYFAKFLGRTARTYALVNPVNVLYLGGKPLEAFNKYFYDDFIREFLSDKINSWWLRKIVVAKLNPDLNLTLEGLKVLAEKVKKEMQNEK
ncbi:MAG: glucokinase [Acidobacteria bacterium]|nr:glucokinase [Acidobacteriota bacterium]